MSYTFEQVVEKVNSLHDKYKNYTDKIFLRSKIEAKHYGLKLYIRVVDLHPEPVDIANVTLRLLYEGEHPILDTFLQCLDFTIAKLLDLYDQELPEIENDDDDVPDLI